MMYVNIELNKRIKNPALIWRMKAMKMALTATMYRFFKNMFLSGSLLKIALAGNDTTRHVRIFVVSRSRPETPAKYCSKTRKGFSMACLLVVVLYYGLVIEFVVASFQAARTSLFSQLAQPIDVHETQDIYKKINNSNQNNLKKNE